MDATRRSSKRQSLFSRLFGRKEKQQTQVKTKTPNRTPGRIHDPLQGVAAHMRSYFTKKPKNRKDTPKGLGGSKTIGRSVTPRAFRHLRERQIKLLRFIKFGCGRYGQSKEMLAKRYTIYHPGTGDVASTRAGRPARTKTRRKRIAQAEKHVNARNKQIARAVVVKNNTNFNI